MYFRLTLCALLLGPFAALAQEEEPAVEEVQVIEAAPAEEAPVEEAPAAEAAAEEAPTEEASAEESADEGPGLSFAPAAGSFVDVLYVPSSMLTTKAGGASANEYGDGFGGRGLYRVGKHLAANGEYQWRRYEDVDVEISEMRLGVGLMGDSSSGGTGGLFLEYDKQSSDQLGDTDGFSVHVRLSNKPLEWFQFYGDLGYLQLDGDAEKLTGNEFTAGISVVIGDTSALFADWRRTALEGKDSGARVSIADFRVGARFSFGAAGDDSGS